MPLITDILERIGTLYGIEAEVRGRPPDVRLAARQTRTKPLVDALREALDAALRRLSPKSDMAKAIAYGTKRWLALCRFLDDGRLEIEARSGSHLVTSARPFTNTRIVGYLRAPHPDLPDRHLSRSAPEKRAFNPI